MATSHYRTILSFSEESLEQAEKSYSRLVNALYSLKKIIKEREADYRLSERGLEILEELSEIRRGFYESMDRDFNASRAFSYVYRLTSLTFKDVAEVSELAPAYRAYSLLEEFNKVLGVLDEHFAEAPALVDLESLVELVVEVRSRLRARKDYELSDWIRERLRELGIKLFDDRDRTTWTYA